MRCCLLTVFLGLVIGGEISAEPPLAAEPQPQPQLQPETVAGTARLYAEQLRAGPEPGVIRGGIPVIRVGNDAGCDRVATASVNGFQQAIDAAASDANGPSETEIRVANTGNYGNRRFFLNDLVDQSVTIIGGYSSCAATSPASSTTLDRGGATLGPVLLIDETAGNELVIIANFVMTGGGHSFGGGLEIRNNNFVLLDDVEVSENWADDGGGLSLTDVDDGIQTVLWLLGSSAVSNNLSVFSGGGIFCRGNQAGIALDTDVSISLNTSLTNGGGIFAGGGCSIDSFASYPAGIYANTADNDGGAAYINTGARLALIGGTGGFGFGNTARRTTLDGNGSARHGGGVYVTGPGSQFIARDAWVFGNTADSDGNDVGSGGAGALRNGAAFLMDRTLAGSACHQTLRCSRLAGNTAFSGGALWGFGDDVEIDLRQTWIDDNRVAAGGIGSAILNSNVAGDPALPARLFIEGSMVVNNRPLGTGDAIQGTIDVQVNTDTTIAFSTFADNLIGDFGREISATNTATIRTYSSIFRESIGRVFGANWSVNTGRADCILTYSDAGFPPSRTAILVGSPQFGADLLLTGGSPAVDFCDDVAYAPVESDILGFARGIDTLGVPVHLGPFDLGAAEFAGTLDGGTVRFTTPVVEVPEDHGTLTIPIERVDASEGTLEVLVFTLDGTALQGADYLEFDDTVSWSAGDAANRNIFIPILDDGSAEDRESLTVNLALIDGAGAVGPPSTLVVTIFDNEQGIFADGFEGGGSL